MITNVKIKLSDLERNHLAVAMDNKVSKRLASRGDVTRVATNNVHIKILGGEELIKLEKANAGKIRDGAGRNVVPAGESKEPTTARGHAVQNSGMEHQEERRTPSYLTSPSAAILSTACSRVLQHIKENESDDTLNFGWCASILLETGIE